MESDLCFSSVYSLANAKLELCLDTSTRKEELVKVALDDTCLTLHL